MIQTLELPHRICKQPSQKYFNNQLWIYWRQFFKNLLASPHGIRGVLDPRPGIKLTASIVKTVQSWPTLCDPVDYTVHGILQSRILEWVAIPFSRGSSQPRDWVQVSCISGRFFTSWATREAQEYWSGEPIPSPADLPDPGIEPGSPAFRWILYQLSFQGSFHLPCAMWNLPRPGIKQPVSPPLVGRLLVTGPPGKSQGQTLNHFPELM